MINIDDFRPIPGFQSYLASRDGVILSMKYGRPKILSQGTVKRGYKVVILRELLKSHTKLVHHLVLFTFVGPKPKGMSCCHGDGNPANNHIENLRWDTAKANAQDAIKHGTILRGEKQPNSKLTAEQVALIKSSYASGGLFQKDLAEAYGVSVACISSVIRGTRWKS